MSVYNYKEYGMMIDDWRRSQTNIHVSLTVLLYLWFYKTFHGWPMANHDFACFYTIQSDLDI